MAHLLLYVKYMYISNTLSNRGLFNLTAPLLADLEESLYQNSYFSEEEDTYSLEVEMPGYDKEDVKINLNKEGYIILRGETKRKGESVKFGRSYPIPKSANPNTIKAYLEKGILTLNLQKKEKYKPKEIKID